MLEDLPLRHSCMKVCPLGPYVTLLPNAAEIEATFNAPYNPTKLTHAI